MQGRRMVGTLALVAVMAAVVGAGTAVWASHQFSDVGNTHPFHAEISDVADACVIAGFDDGTFRPSNPVTRQAVAAFLARGLGRVEVAEGPSGFLPGDDGGATAGPMTLATVDVEVPDLPACHQHVQLTGQASVSIDTEQQEACGAIVCHVDLELTDHDGTVVGSARHRFTSDFDATSLTVTAVVPATGGTSTYGLQATTWLVKENSAAASNIRLVATTHPLGDSFGHAH
jgi:hypothetical protein